MSQTNACSDVISAVAECMVRWLGSCLSVPDQCLQWCGRIHGANGQRRPRGTRLGDTQARFNLNLAGTGTGAPCINLNLAVTGTGAPCINLNLAGTGTGAPCIKSKDVKFDHPPSSSHRCPSVLRYKSMMVPMGLEKADSRGMLYDRSEAGLKPFNLTLTLNPNPNPNPNPKAC